MIQTTATCATLSVAEAAAVLGVSRTTMYALVRSASVPHLRFGRTLRLPRQSFDAWMNAQATRALDGRAEAGR